MVVALPAGRQVVEGDAVSFINTVFAAKNGCYHPAGDPASNSI